MSFLQEAKLKRDNAIEECYCKAKQQLLVKISNYPCDNIFILFED